MKLYLSQSYKSPCKNQCPKDYVTIPYLRSHCSSVCSFWYLLVSIFSFRTLNKPSASAGVLPQEHLMQLMKSSSSCVKLRTTPVCKHVHDRIIFEIAEVIKQLPWKKSENVTTHKRKMSRVFLQVFGVWSSLSSCFFFSRTR